MPSVEIVIPVSWMLFQFLYYFTLILHKHIIFCSTEQKRKIELVLAGLKKGKNL